MNMKKFLISAALLSLAGCGTKPSPENGKDIPAKSDTQTVRFRISEYPSWAAFKVAERQGLIDARPGHLGSLEKKHGVDIDQGLLTYEAGMAEYSASGGAVCITNTDAPAAAQSRDTTAFLATSTSAGADANVVIRPQRLAYGKIQKKDFVHKFLSENETFGLDQSVSLYVFDRCLEELGLNPALYKFSNKDPEAAAQLLQLKSINSAMLWNPFVLQIIRNNPDAFALFDSTQIRGEVVDMVVMDSETYRSKAGQSAAKVICEAYYTVCTSLGKNPAVDVDTTKADAEYEALGAEFSNLNAEDMRICCEMTQFYATPAQGIEVFNGKKIRETMPKVWKWAVKRQNLKGQYAAVEAPEFSTTLRKSPQHGGLIVGFGSKDPKDQGPGLIFSTWAMDAVK
jgi:NitT/TauT family transport system substrate-binding protein